MFYGEASQRRQHIANRDKLIGIPILASSARKVAHISDWMREAQPKDTVRPLRTAKENFIAAA